jgi:membrane protease YdiL (CAAX protease family)
VGAGKSIVTFFGLAFLFTWALLPAARTSTVIGLIALFGPAAAALIAAALAGREQLHHLASRTTLWRVPVRWFIIALAFPLLISALASSLEYVGGARGTIELQRIPALSAVVFVLVIGEEIGWRGFALPQLLTRFAPWSASVILGVAWALWHLPLFFLPGMPQFGSPFPSFVIYTIALSVILTFLSQHTRGSVIIATLFHGAVNTFLLVNRAASPELRGWVNAASYGAVALLIGVLAWRRKQTVHDVRPMVTSR